MKDLKDHQEFLYAWHFEEPEPKYMARNVFLLAIGSGIGYIFFCWIFCQGVLT